MYIIYKVRLVLCDGDRDGADHGGDLLKRLVRVADHGVRVIEPQLRDELLRRLVDHTPEHPAQLRAAQVCDALQSADALGQVFRGVHLAGEPVDPVDLLSVLEPQIILQERTDDDLALIHLLLAGVALQKLKILPELLELRRMCVEDDAVLARAQPGADVERCQKWIHDSGGNGADAGLDRLRLAGQQMAVSRPQDADVARALIIGFSVDTLEHASVKQDRNFIEIMAVLHIGKFTVFNGYESESEIALCDPIFGFIYRVCFGHHSKYPRFCGGCFEHVNGLLLADGP